MESKEEDLITENLNLNQNKEDKNEEKEEEFDQKNDCGECYEFEEDEDTKGNDQDYGNSPTSGQKRKKRLVYITFQQNYDYNSNYFCQELTQKEENEIRKYIEKFLLENSTNKEDLINFFSKYPNIIKGNSKKIHQILNESSEKYPNLSSFKIINDFILSEYYTPKPSICESYFFPNGANEKYVVNMLRTCKKSLDIAIYSFTLESIALALIEVHNRGIPVRVICDNECERKSTSKIKKLASVGIVCKTDNCSYYMHHKFAVIDASVIITGSFNWSTQAVNHNQENILFFENKYLAEKYLEQFNKLWSLYDNCTINKEEAKKYVEEKERIRKEKIEKEKEKEKKRNERLKDKEIKMKEKEALIKQKEIDKLEKKKSQEQKELEKLERQKEREMKKLEKEKEKEKIEKEKEKEKQKFEKEKQKLEKEKQKLEKEKEKQKKEKEKEKEKLEKEKEKQKLEKEKQKLEKEKEKQKKEKEKEKEKLEKEKEKQKLEKEKQKLEKEKEKQKKEKENQKLEKGKEKKKIEEEKEKNDKEKGKKKLGKESIKELENQSTKSKNSKRGKKINEKAFETEIKQINWKQIDSDNKEF